MNLPTAILPPDAGGFAKPVDWLFWGLTGLSALVVFGLVVVIGFFLIKYRRNSPATHTAAETSIGLEITWTAIPLLAFTVIFALGASTYLKMASPPDDALEIYVTGRQWMWEFYRDDGPTELAQLHVPAGTPIRLTMISEDVIHSFYVPALRMKHDLVPGRYVTAWFEAEKPGTYPIYCAEYCGDQHSQMRGKLVVMPPADYARWLEQGNAKPTLAARGQQLYHDHGCSGCHEAGSTVHAPSLNRLYGSVVHIQDGTSVQADAAYIRDSILLPQKQIVAGYDDVMPSFDGQIGEDDLFALIAYLKSRADNPR
ncbi:cytochrome c oxidase subunit II [Haloferula sargassicola]|uniref:cytochrome-c oxidase n=1 Tax=Haloferula sargassicola TaxID=490096 RepID=A0ABP9UGQ4_9BACT